MVSKVLPKPGDGDSANGFYYGDIYFQFNYSGILYYDDICLTVTTIERVKFL